MSKFTEVLKACDNFKKTTYYWDHNSLTHEENSIRNYPAPWITKTVELLKIIEGNVVVKLVPQEVKLLEIVLSTIIIQ